MSVTVLLIEDEPAIQELIAFNLTQAGYQVVKASSAEMGWDYIKQIVPDLILLDWMLPAQSGVEMAKQLRRDERTSTVPIIMLTARSEEADKVTGLETGADDYITKPFSPRELMARIKAVLRRRAPELTDDIVEVNGLAIDPSSRRVRVGENKLALGPTEFKLLHFLMTHQERIYSRTQLLDLVWGDHVYLEERTVDVHIRRLRSVLEDTGHDRLIQTVRGAGYRFSIK